MVDAGIAPPNGKADDARDMDPVLLLRPVIEPLGTGAEGVLRARVVEREILAYVFLVWLLLLLPSRL